MLLEFGEEMALKNFMPKESDLKRMSTFFYAFSDDTRLRIIILLSMRALCVSNISQVLGVNQTTISHQLKILRSLEILDSDREGKNIVYYIKNREIENVLNATVDCI